MDPYRELQKLAELRHRLLEAYKLSQEIGPARPKRAPGERFDPQTPEEQRPTSLDVLIANAIAETEKQIWEIEPLLEKRGGG
jgi:hypothetical protein